MMFSTVGSSPIIGVIDSDVRWFTSPSRKSANALKAFGPAGANAVRPPLNENVGVCVS